MMVGHVITVNPTTSKTTYSGITQSFEIEFNGEEAASSTFKLPNFTGETDDILAMRLLDGAGYLKPDTRVSGYRPAYYYGVITAVDKDTSMEDENSSEQESASVQCTDFKTYLYGSFIPEATTTHSSPFAYLKAIFDRWTIHDNVKGIPMKCLSSTVSYRGPAFYYASPTEAGTDELMTLFGRAFKYYQIPLVVVDDTINTTSSMMLSCMFISGVNVGTVVIDDSVQVRNADVTERPVGDGDYNAIAIGKTNYKKTTKKVTTGTGKKKKTVKKTIKTYQNVTKHMRYITTGGSIVSSITSAVKKPVRLTAVVDDDKTKYDKIAKDNLSVTPYSHEITFDISIFHPSIINGLAEIGNSVKLLYKGKAYSSYVSSIKVTSTSEFITITCGNSKGKQGIGSLIDTNAKKIKGSTSSSASGATATAVVSSSSLATSADIDGFF